MPGLKRLWPLLLLFALPARAQQTAFLSQNFSATGSSSVVGLSTTGTQQNQLQWFGFGTLATCTVKLEQSSTGTGGWTDLIADDDCTANGTGTLTAGNPNFIRITVTAISGGGNVTVRYTGSRTVPSAGGGLTNTELRASPVEVDCTTCVSGGALTDMELRAAPVEVDVTASVLPTGAATSAKQDTIIGHVDGIEGLLTTIDGDTSTLAGIDFATETTLAAVARESGGNLDTIAGLLGTIDADTSALAGTDFMLGTDFSDVFGTASLILGTQADDVANTADGLQTTAFGYVFDGSTWDRLRGDSANGVLVNLGANNDVTVTGSVTANAGTNLNTSLLALESGGNLAGAATSLAIIDDWDESDRAKVNPIVGQAGVQGGSGSVSNTTQRVVLATDVALPTGSNAIGKLAANSGVDIGDVDVTSIAAGTNLIGDVGLQPRTSNGLSTFMATGSDGSTALTNSAQAIKASAGQVFCYYIYNPNATAQFVHFYNTAAASVTVGTTNPQMSLTIPATAGANLCNDMGWTFSNAGFSIAATSTAGGNGAPSSALDAVIGYK